MIGRQLRIGLFRWLRASLPGPVKNWLWRTGWVRRFGALDPFYGRGYVHLLTAGPLRGHRLVTPLDAMHLVNLPYEPDVCKTLTTFLRPGAVCADVGAHVGYMTLLMAKLVGPRGRVYAIEADSDNVEMLRRNVHLNGYSKRVRILHMAAWDGSAEAVPFPQDHPSLSGQVCGDGEEGERFVRAAALDTELADLARLDLVKMDIERSEAAAVRGMLGLLRRLKPVIVLEAHDREGEEALQVLADKGYALTDWQDRLLKIPAIRRPIHIIGRPCLPAGHFGQ